MCGSGFILSLDKLSCQSLNDEAGSFCSSAFISEEPKCDVCNLGYTKDEKGKCNLSKISKCWIMDQSGLSCILCETGTYMDSSGKCIFEFTSSYAIFDIFLVYLIIISLFFYSN
jgi:hypothetical protein